MAVSRKLTRRQRSGSRSNPKRGPSSYCSACQKNSCQTDCSKSVSNPKSKNSLQKLFTAIQQFHNNLCSLSLDMLINSTHPDVWIEQQMETCQQLESKLKQMSQRQVEAGRKSNLEYYQAKMQSVKMVLNNITVNMKTLRDIYDRQLLSQYNSARSSNINQNAWFSSSSSSKREGSSQRQKQSPQQLQSSSFKLSHFSPTPHAQANKIYKRQQSQYEIETKNYGRLDNLISQASEQEQKKDPYSSALGKYNEIIRNIRRNSIGSSRQQQNQNQNTQNFTNISTVREEPHKKALNLHTCLSEQEDIYQADQEGQEYVITSPNVKTKRVGTSNNPSIKLTEAKQVHSNLYSLLEMMKSGVGPYYRANTHIQTLESETAVLDRLKPIIQELNQVKSELKMKSKEIQNLLITQQELETVIELLQRQAKSHIQQGSFSNQRIKNLESLVQKYEQQVKDERQIHTELRQTIKNQAASMLVIQKQRQDLQNSLDKSNSLSQLLTKQLNSLKQQFADQLHQCRKRQKISKQKMQIYKHKYYKLVHQQEMRKITIKQTYSGKAGKLKQINDILDEHRRNLSLENGEHNMTSINFQSSSFV